MDCLEVPAQGIFFKPKVQIVFYSNYKSLYDSATKDRHLTSNKRCKIVSVGELKWSS